jgi:hypothetical protein
MLRSLRLIRRGELFRLGIWVLYHRYIHHHNCSPATLHFSPIFLIPTLTKRTSRYAYIAVSSPFQFLRGLAVTLQAALAWTHPNDAPAAEVSTIQSFATLPLRFHVPAVVPCIIETVYDSIG